MKKLRHETFMHENKFSCVEISYFHAWRFHFDDMPMHENENVPPGMIVSPQKFSWVGGMYTTPCMESSPYENFWSSFSFSCITISPSCMKTKFSCMNFSFRNYFIYETFRMGIAKYYTRTCQDNLKARGINNLANQTNIWPPICYPALWLVRAIRKRTSGICKQAHTIWFTYNCTNNIYLQFTNQEDLTNNHNKTKHYLEA